jgi:winged helix DNA-binding protein
MPLQPSGAPRRATDIAHRRLGNQQLLAPTLTEPAEVVRRLGAVQAQDYAGAKWAVGMRTRGRAVDAVVERALSDGSILRTHVLRPTWHFVTPADIRWMLALTAPRVKAAMAYYDRTLELDAAVFRRSHTALTRALRDGKQLTRAQLAQVLRRARVDATGTQRLGHLVMRAELDGLVCSGARRGKQGTYALLEERVPPGPALDRDAALLELIGRYFATRGPATLKDFAWWSGLTLADAKKGVQIAGRRLEREVSGDETYWFDPSARSPRKRSPIAHLLPNYDEYFIGFKDRSAIGRRLSSTEIAMGRAALTAHVIVVDGQLVGGWKRALTPTAVVVELTLLAGVSESEKKAVIAAAQGFGHFCELPVELRGL